MSKKCTGFVIPKHLCLQEAINPHDAFGVCSVKVSFTSSEGKISNMEIQVSTTTDSSLSIYTALSSAKGKE